MPFELVCLYAILFTYCVCFRFLSVVNDTTKYHRITYLKYTVCMVTNQDFQVKKFSLADFRSKNSQNWFLRFAEKASSLQNHKDEILIRIVVFLRSASVVLSIWRFFSLFRSNCIIEKCCDYLTTYYAGKYHEVELDGILFVIFQIIMDVAGKQSWKLAPLPGN